MISIVHVPVRRNSKLGSITACNKLNAQYNIEPYLVYKAVKDWVGSMTKMSISRGMLEKIMPGH